MLKCAQSTRQRNKKTSLRTTNTHKYIKKKISVHTLRLSRHKNTSVAALKKAIPIYKHML